MPDRFSDRSLDQSSEEDLRGEAAFAARRSPSGIGAAVARSGYRDGERFWECIVSDGEQWHFIQVLGIDLGPSEDVPIEEIEQGIERYAATLPESNRLDEVLGANPLHVDESGAVSD